MFDNFQSGICVVKSAVFVCSQLLSHIWLFVTPWTVAGQTSRKEHCVATFFARASSWLMDQNCIFCITCIGRWILYTAQLGEPEHLVTVTAQQTHLFQTGKETYQWSSLSLKSTFCLFIPPCIQSGNSSYVSGKGAQINLRDTFQETHCLSVGIYSSPVYFIT